MPPLETERLLLRDFVLGDWDALNAFLSDPAVTRFMHFASWDEGKRRAWLTWLVQEASNPHRDADNAGDDITEYRTAHRMTDHWQEPSCRRGRNARMWLCSRPTLLGTGLYA